jgi:hypothetical protein
MKKLLLLATGMLCVVGLRAADAGNVSDWKSDLSGSVAVKFETEHVERGRKFSQKAFAPSARLEYRVHDLAKAYVGVDSAIALKSHDVFVHNPVSPYIGLTYDVTDMFTVDGGYMHRFYTGAKRGDRIGKRNSNEIFLGVMADVIASPSLYCFYNFDHREFAVEGAVNHSFDLSQQVAPGLGIDVGAKIGFDTSSRPYGLTYKKLYANGKKIGKDGYCYYGLNADLVYGLGGEASAKVGVAFSGNLAKKQAWPNINSKGKEHVWFNAAVDCSF